MTFKISDHTPDIQSLEVFHDPPEGRLANHPRYLWRTKSSGWNGCYMPG
jgi:hypothetical protein